MKTQQLNYSSDHGKGLVSRCSGEILAIQFEILGTLQSYRDKDQNKYRSAKHNNIKRAQDGESWLLKIIGLGVTNEIIGLVEQCKKNIARVQINATIYRKIPIRDMKNLMAGFDHMILDPLVRKGILRGDGMNDIMLHVHQLRPQPEFFDGQDCVVVRMQEERSGTFR